MNPGANDALSLGCTCDAFANQYGLGVGDIANGVPTRVFQVNIMCPLHGALRWAAPGPVIECVSLPTIIYGKGD